MYIRHTVSLEKHCIPNIFTVVSKLVRRTVIQTPIILNVSSFFVSINFHLVGGTTDRQLYDLCYYNLLHHVKISSTCKDDHQLAAAENLDCQWQKTALKPHELLNMDCQNHVIPIPGLTFPLLEFCFQRCSRPARVWESRKATVRNSSSFEEGKDNSICWLTSQVSSHQSCQQLCSHNPAGSVGAGTDTQIAV